MLLIAGSGGTVSSLAFTVLSAGAPSSRRATARLRE